MQAIRKNGKGFDEAVGFCSLARLGEQRNWEEGEMNKFSAARERLAAKYGFEFTHRPGEILDFYRPIAGEHYQDKISGGYGQRFGNLLSAKRDGISIMIFDIWAVRKRNHSLRYLASEEYLKDQAQEYVGKKLTGVLDPAGVLDPDPNWSVIVFSADVFDFPEYTVERRSFFNRFWKARGEIPIPNMPELAQKNYFVRGEVGSPENTDKIQQTFSSPVLEKLNEWKRPRIFVRNNFIAFDVASSGTMGPLTFATHLNECWQMCRAFACLPTGDEFEAVIEAAKPADTSLHDVDVWSS